MAWNLQTSVAGATQMFPAHDHCGQVNETSSGQTSMDANHTHAIVNGVIRAAQDGHTHQLIRTPCARHGLMSNGSGAKPCNCGRKG